VETVVLCLDSDQAGRDAADRAFMLCAKEGLRVEGVRTGQKDPADAAQESPESLKQTLETSHPYITMILDEMSELNKELPSVRQSIRDRVFPLIASLASSADRTHYLQHLATVLSATGAEIGTTVVKLESELQQFEQQGKQQHKEEAVHTASLYSSAELTLALFLLHPRSLVFLGEMLPPDEPFALALFSALQKVAHQKDVTVDMLELDELQRERTRILLLYCEQSGFSDWNESIASREIRHNCRRVNRELLQRKQKEITQRLIVARRDGKADEEQKLAGEYQQLLQLGRVALL
jgi:DNA primase